MATINLIIFSYPFDHRKCNYWWQYEVPWKQRHHLQNFETTLISYNYTVSSPQLSKKEKSKDLRMGKNLLKFVPSV
ncbi:5075_t:CDS:2 [Dentiscutata heterogama]|uniref:5075_t:CDS:1 n=1 Tax=Dentiscutata heterogama TaxID=1316150 RepID=A0ACA9K6W1_9GLOM|nr:5075_t:CDS:2 [Dentiscutata heterogama]